MKKILNNTLFLSALVGLLSCNLDKQEHIEQKNIKQDNIEQIIDSENSKPIKTYKLSDIKTDLYFNDSWAISSQPKNKTGINADINVFVSDENYTSKVAKLILYEDKKKIHSKEDSKFISFSVKHKTAGTHTYHARAIDNDGNHVDSKKIVINFTGENLDAPPKIRDIIISNDKQLYINAQDIGDNKGLKSILLYEDAKAIRKFNCSSHTFTKTIPLSNINQSGTHNYFIQAVDIGGNKSRSKTIQIDYN